MLCSSAVLSAPGDLVGLHQGHTGAVNDVITNGSWIYSASADATVIKWSLDAQDLFHRFVGHLASVNAVFAYGSFIYSVSDDGTLKKWNATSGVSVRDYVGHSGAVLCVFVSGDYIFSASVDTTVIYEWHDRSYNRRPCRTTAGLVCLVDITLFSQSRRLKQ